MIGGKFSYHVGAGNPLIKCEMDLQCKIKDLKMEKSRYSEKIYELQDNIRVKYPNQIQLLTTNIEKSLKDSSTANQGASILRIGGVSYDMTDPDIKKSRCRCSESGTERAEEHIRGCQQTGMYR